MTTLLGTYAIDDLRRGSFIRGFATVMNLRGNTRRLYRFGASPAQVDRDAIANDWARVGDDLRAAVATYQGS